MSRLQLQKNMILGGIILASFALVAALLVALTYESTIDQIAENERQALLKSLHTLVPPDQHDNDMFTDLIQVRAEELASSRSPFITVYRARQGTRSVAAILEVIARDGYSGEIKMLVAINYNNHIAGVRVINHRETPGLGDAVETRKSKWIHMFNGKSLIKPVPRSWAVRKDGGQFDQLTGATITSRAVVSTTKKALEYFDIHKHELFLRAQ